MKTRFMFGFVKKKLYIYIYNLKAREETLKVEEMIGKSLCSFKEPLSCSRTHAGSIHNFAFWTSILEVGTFFSFVLAQRAVKFSSKYISSIWILVSISGSVLEPKVCGLFLMWKME